MKVRTWAAGTLFAALAAAVATVGFLAPRGGRRPESAGVQEAPSGDAPLSEALSPRAAEAADVDPVMKDAWPDLKFDKPVCLAYPEDGSDRLFVAQRGGKILSAKKWRGAGPAPASKTFLDISGLQAEEAIENGQGGLLSVAFHPKYKTDGRFFVFYGTGLPKPQAVLASYRVSAGDPDRADPKSGQVLIAVDKPHTAHYGGGLLFGPDGKLYVGFGDSGTPDDPDHIGQDVRRLDSKILRIDVDAGSPYGIPADNPWAQQQGVKGEIWAYGVRNPWRFSFDRETGNLWLGDPGQKRREEIDVVPRAGNMGWALREGSLPLQQGPLPRDYVPPVFDYGRELGSCVIGGVVYHGQRCASIRGQYVFADFMKGQVFAMPVSGKATTGAPRALAELESCASINEDAQGELYFCALDAGRVLTLVPAP